MKKSDNLYLRLVKHFYGVEGVMDEYKQAEVNRIGNNAFIVLTLYLMVADLVAAICAAIYSPDVVLLSFIWANMIIIMLVFSFILYKTNRLHLTNIEVSAENRSSAIRKLKIHGIWYTLYFGTWMWLTNIFLDVLFDQAPLLKAVRDLDGLRRAAIAGVLFGLWMYIYRRLQIRKVD